MILKIDTTNSDKTVVELEFDNGKRDKLVLQRKVGSQVLLPMIAEILKKNKLTISNLSAIEVNPGPGSFTGTRVGVALANSLGFALDVPINGKKGKIVIPKYTKSKFDL